MSGCVCVAFFKCIVAAWACTPRVRCQWLSSRPSELLASYQLIAHQMADVFAEKQMR
jgi:hypothetical protein